MIVYVFFLLLYVGSNVGSAIFTCVGLFLSWYRDNYKEDDDSSSSSDDDTIQTGLKPQSKKNFENSKVTPLENSVDSSMYDTQWKLNLTNAYIKAKEYPSETENEIKTHRTIMPEDDMSIEEAYELDNFWDSRTTFKEENMFVPFEDSKKTSYFS